MACLLASACYVSTTTLPSGIAAGQSVHLELNDAGSATLTPVLGPRALALDGRVVARTDSSLDLAISDITRIGGGEETWHGATVTIPSNALGRVQARRFSAFQTVLLVGVGIAALVGVAAAVKGSDDLGSGTRGGNPNPGK